MGLLDEILGGIARGGLGGLPQGGAQPTPSRQAQPQPQAAGGGAFGNVVVALLPVILEMLASRAAGGAGTAARRGPATGSLAPAGPGDAGGLGGLGGLLEQLQKMGYGEQARSWVGTGPNVPLEREDITQVFGRDRLGQIAAQAGISEEEASGGLAALLPEVVDRLTPGGEVPGLDDLVAGVRDMQRRLDGGSR